MNNSYKSSARSSLPVAVDAMGGDFGPGVVVEGAVRAFRELGIHSILVGDEHEIRSKLSGLGAASESGIRIRKATEVITMEDSPSMAIRGKPDASIRVAFELVRSEEACCVVSPGNTGAVMAAGLFVCGSLPGIARPAIATLIPRVGNSPPVVLLDSGANTDCHAYQLVQFALMGRFYALAAGLGSNPRVALLSNGTEISKGNDIIRSAALSLSEMKDINFVGYVEGRHIAKDLADIIICDGFIGNITLKTMEGTVELVFDSIKHYIESSIRGRLGIWLAKPMFKSLFREKLDPSSHGGAPLLGLNEIAIICHGSSNARAIMNAIRIAEKCVNDQLVDRIGSAIDSMDFKMPGSYDDGIWDRMGQRFEKKRKGKEASRSNERASEDPESDVNDRGSE